jgi:hypothetical protein
MVPEVHSSQFYADNEDDWKIIKWATSFFKDKWWRDDNEKAEWERYKFIRGMRTHANSVWKPIVEADHWTSASYNITWHSLDSLVWMFVTRADLPHVTFAELYLFFVFANPSF